MPFLCLISGSRPGYKAPEPSVAKTAPPLPVAPRFTRHKDSEFCVRPPLAGLRPPLAGLWAPSSLGYGRCAPGRAPPRWVMAPPSLGYASPSLGYAPPLAGLQPPPLWVTAPPSLGYGRCAAGYGPPLLGYSPPSLGYGSVTHAFWSTVKRMAYQSDGLRTRIVPDYVIGQNGCRVRVCDWALQGGGVGEHHWPA